MKRIYSTLIVALALFSGHIQAQQKQFSSSDEAVKFLDDMCRKYWLVNTKEGDISREVTVYRNGCQLYFNEKSIMKGKTAKDGSENNLVINTLVSVNLRRVKQTCNYTSLEFAGGKKDIVTLITRDNNQLNNKTQASSRYKVGLDYSNQLLKNNLYDITTAANYLINQCHGKVVKKKRYTHHTKK